MSQFLPPPTFPVAVDLVILTVRHARLETLLVRRRYAPFAGELALPGGFVQQDESLEDAALRELAEETSVGPGAGHLEQLATYGDVGRDPRGRVISVASMLLAPSFPAPHGGSDALEANWHATQQLLEGRTPLAFDHRQILADGVERARAKLEYSALAAAFCPPEFTIAQLRGVYEAVWGVQLDPRNFHRKATSTPGFVEATGHTTADVSLSALDGGRAPQGRPAATYRLAAPDPAGVVLHPPLLRP